MFEIVLNIPLDFLSCVAMVLRERYSGLFDICQTDCSVFPLFRSHSWKYNIQANKKLTKVKEK